MKLYLLLTISSFAMISARDSCSPQGAFSLKLENECSLEALQTAYAAYLAAPENQILSSYSCGGQDLEDLLGGQDVDELCRNAFDLNGEITFDEIVQQEDSKFVESFYRGNTYWNEEVQTNYDLDDPNGPAINVLKEDISQVPAYYELAEYKRVKYPDEHDNFSLDNCALNAVMCCWSLDRQANDNNGNCAKPYDTNCIDKDPADNTDICGVHLDRGNSSNNLNADGFTTFRGGNNDGEGPAHCHGFAFSNNENDAETRYMGNNLFYISMYDHLYKRGYARNIPGAPMCGCVEQMPVVTRSDCTQVDVTETFTFRYNPVSGFSVKASNVNVDFNSCQGLNKNNDLSSYVARLETEGKVTLAQKNGLKDHLVESNNCPNAIERNLASKGIIRGLSENTYDQTYSFPSTDTDKLVHGICVLGASHVNAVSDTDYELSYTLVPDFQDGVKLWDDRDYVAQGITGPEMCEGGIYLKPNKHKSIPRFTDITFGASPSIDGDYLSMCVFVVSSDSRTGKWDEILPNDRFEVSDEFTWSDGNNSGKMRSYCKTLPEPPTPAPSPSPTRAGFGASYAFPPVQTNQFVHGICTMGATYAEATSTDPDLTYTLIPEFQNGVKMWGDRNYITSEVSGDELCEGGIYLQPSRHKSIDKNTEILFEASPIDGGSVTVCAFVSIDSRDGKWDEVLPTEGFTVSSTTFKWSHGNVSSRMYSYCKTLS